MKLYYAPGACSLAPHIILREIARPFDLVRVDLKNQRTASGEDYRQINSKGLVPVLELDSGEHLTEGPVIAQYLCDQARREDLMPAAGSLPRYRVMEWQNYITAELHKSFSPLFWADSADATKAQFAALLRKKYEWVSRQLQDRDYLTGATFTAADAYLFVVTHWSGYVKLDLSDLQPLQAFQARVAARPAVKEALHAEGLLR